MDVANTHTHTHRNQNSNSNNTNIFTKLFSGYHGRGFTLSSPQHQNGWQHGGLSAADGSGLPHGCMLQLPGNEVVDARGTRKSRQGLMMSFPSRLFRAFDQLMTTPDRLFAEARRLYGTYGAELYDMHQRARRFCSGMHDASERTRNRSFTQRGAKLGVACMLNVIEAEWTYMRIREVRPANVLECAPNTGYSTLWLLAAVAANHHVSGQAWGQVHSYDIDNVIYREKLQSVLGWSTTDFEQAHHMHVGDARKIIPEHIEHGPWGRGRSDEGPFFEYLFLDAEHTARFGRFLGKEIIQRQARRQDRRRTPVSLHDVFFTRRPQPEALAVFEALEEGGILNHTHGELFSFSRCRLQPAHWQSLLDARRESLGSHFVYHQSHHEREYNSMAFMEF